MAAGKEAKEVNKGVRMSPDFWQQVCWAMHREGFDPNREFSIWARRLFSEAIQLNVQLDDETGKQDSETGSRIIYVKPDPIRGGSTARAQVTIRKAPAADTQSDELDSAGRDEQRHDLKEIKERFDEVTVEMAKFRAVLKQLIQWGIKEIDPDTLAMLLEPDEEPDTPGKPPVATKNQAQSNPPGRKFDLAHIEDKGAQTSDPDLPFASGEKKTKKGK